MQDYNGRLKNYNSSEAFRSCYSFNETPFIMAAIERGEDLEHFSSHSKWQIRLAVAEAGACQDFLAKDEMWVIRATVAQNGNCLQSLKYDSDYRVRLAAYKKLLRDAGVSEELIALFQEQGLLASPSDKQFEFNRLKTLVPNKPQKQMDSACRVLVVTANTEIDVIGFTQLQGGTFRMRGLFDYGLNKVIKGDKYHCDQCVCDPRMEDALVVIANFYPNIKEIIFI